MNCGEAPAIIAFNDCYHDSSFCLYRDDEVIHVEMERITRRKYETQSPVVGFCRLYPGQLRAFDLVVIAEGDFLAPLVRKILRNRELVDDAEQLIGLLNPAGPDGRSFSDSCSRSIKSTIQEFFRQLVEAAPRLFFCGHHEAHAANAFFSSGLPSALTLTLDGGGNDYRAEQSGDRPWVIHGGAYTCSGTTIRRISYLRRVSFGWAWIKATKALGLAWGEEGTVMAMAALGDPMRFKSIFDAPFFWMPYTGSLDPATAAAAEAFFSQAARQLRSDEDRYDFAAALQSATERRVESWMRRFVTEDVADLCVAGGIFLNCQLLGKISRWFPQLRNIFIPPAPYDGGISLGAAQALLHGRLGFRRTIADRAMAPFAMGKSYPVSDVIAAACARNLVPQPVSRDAIVGLLQAGKILGLFGGAAESGRRALGHRSIIADPRRSEMKTKINGQIKHRQWFRPLAPMVLAEHASQWFECGPNFRSAYMSFAVPVRPGQKDRVPAIVHIDGTARVQTLHRELSTAVYDLVSEWHNRTDVPMLLNTSFNDREPIVETPADALETFARVSLDGVYFIDHGIMVARSDSN